MTSLRPPSWYEIKACPVLKQFEGNTAFFLKSKNGIIINKRKKKFKSLLWDELPTIQTILYAKFGKNRLITLVYTPFLQQFRGNMTMFQVQKWHRNLEIFS